MKKDSLDLFVDEVSTYIEDLFGFTWSDLTIDTKLNDSLIIFNFRNQINELSVFQTVLTIVRNIGRKYGFCPSAHSLRACNDDLIYCIQMGLL